MRRRWRRRFSSRCRTDYVSRGDSFPAGTGGPRPLCFSVPARGAGFLAVPEVTAVRGRGAARLQQPPRPPARLGLVEDAAPDRGEGGGVGRVDDLDGSIELAAEDRFELVDAVDGHGRLLIAVPSRSPNASVPQGVTM